MYQVVTLNINDLNVLIRRLSVDQKTDLTVYYLQETHKNINIKVCKH